MTETRIPIPIPFFWSGTNAAALKVRPQQLSAHLEWHLNLVIMNCVNVYADSSDDDICAKVAAYRK
jgi:hypothetical protein